MEFHLLRGSKVTATSLAFWEMLATALKFKFVLSELLYTARKHKCVSVLSHSLDSGGQLIRCGPASSLPLVDT